MGYGIGMDLRKDTVLSLNRLFFQTILRCIKSLDIPDDCGWRSDPYNWFPESLNDLAGGTTWIVWHLGNRSTIETEPNCISIEIASNRLYFKRIPWFSLFPERYQTTHIRESLCFQDDLPPLHRFASLFLGFWGRIACFFQTILPRTTIHGSLWFRRWMESLCFPDDSS